jgi:phenylpyruvate tautomerase PptA (4-oxalocrotonate tautomerase family)
MPNVTLFIPTETMPSNERLAELSERCTALCTDHLRAALDNVHVITVGVRHGRGHPVFADIRYRLEPFRTPPVMERFMEALDDAIRHVTGLTARIRCFGYAASSIHARN